MLSKKVLLHHDNARPHTAAVKVQTVQQLGFKLPPYSPDLAPSNYHIFSPLKEALHSHRFTSNEEVKEAVHTWLREQPKASSLQEYRNLWNDTTNALCCKGTT